MDTKSAGLRQKFTEMKLAFDDVLCPVEVLTLTLSAQLSLPLLRHES